MPVIKWEPFGVTNRFLEDFPSATPFVNLGIDLAVDVYDEGDNVVAKMNIPGVDPDKIDVSVEDNVLRVLGTHEEEKEEKKKHYYRKEIKKGTFERVVTLPQSVQKEKAVAEYKNGTLKIILPKAYTGESAKKIEIKMNK